jgi:ABC-2 type transport system permease protein
VPLLIVLLAFPAFAAERELGTLRQVMSLGVRPRDLAMGKALGIAAALAALIVPATVIGVLGIGFATGPGALVDDLGRLAVIAVGYLLYFGTFVGLCLAVSVWSKSSRTALIALLAFWIANGLVAPRIASDVSKRLYPTPSALEFGMAVEQDIQHGVNGHDPSDDRAKQLKARVLKQYGVAKVEDLPVSFAGIALQEGEEYGNKVFDKHYAALWGSFERQDEIQRSASALAPLLAIRSLSMGLAGTDGAQHREFARAAESYRRGLVKTVNDDMTAHAKGSDFEYMATDELWAKVDDFSYSAPGLRQVLAAQWSSLVVLSTWFGLSVAAAIVSTGRIKVS